MTILSRIIETKRAEVAARKATISLADLDARIAAVLDHGKYIMGPEVAEFEGKLAEFCGAKHALGCANGTDALQLALMALGAGPGDAVFCPTFTFASTAEIVRMTGATPVFVDVDERTYNLDVESLKRAIAFAKAEGMKPAGVIAVDLFGLPADYDAIEAVAQENGMWVVSDSAQGFGADYNGRRTGSIGTIATTSFFPAKPLGCYGDGGAVFTDDDELRALLDSYRVHGKGTHKYDNERIGLNSRRDTLQAAILRQKLHYLDRWNAERQAILARYRKGLAAFVQFPAPLQSREADVGHLAVIRLGDRNRDKVRAGFAEAGVGTDVHYPVPGHRQPANRAFLAPVSLAETEKACGEVLTLPCFPGMAESDVEHVLATAASVLADSRPIADASASGDRETC